MGVLLSTFFVWVGSNLRLRERLNILFALSRLLILSMYLSVASIVTWSFVPRFLKLMIRLSSQVSTSHSHIFIYSLLHILSPHPIIVGPFNLHGEQWESLSGLLQLTVNTCFLKCVYPENLDQLWLAMRLRKECSNRLFYLVEKGLTNILKYESYNSWTERCHIVSKVQICISFNYSGMVNL